MIIVEKLTKRYRSSQPPVLEALNLRVDRGQISALLGKSGAGKSTLLRCLSGLESFDDGFISVGDVAVNGGESPAPLRGRVGYVFQSLELFPHLNVLENCVLAPVVTGLLAREAAVVDAIAHLTTLDVHTLVDAHPDSLSGGQRQRVAIVRALMMQPQVLLYDEPTSALDPGLKAEVGRTLKAVAERTGMTQVVVTHDPDWARNVADDLFVLENRQLTKIHDG